MEATAYAYGADAVLKVYAGTTSYLDLLTLRDFYASLDRQMLPYALPQIRLVANEPPFLVTIEQRLAGQPLAQLLPDCSLHQLDLLMQRYLAAVQALAQLEAPFGLARYQLSDPHGLSLRVHGDWHQFLVRVLKQKLVQVAAPLQRDVPGFDQKVQHLFEVLARPYTGVYRLIHGDLCPENILITADRQVGAVLDFGLLTMAGDPMFDLATSWVFFDMYDALQVHARERYLTMLLEQLGEATRGQFYRYVLIYSILSANTYSPTCSDGHYAWCVANLATRAYWAILA
jgi:thiamine kinase-like enzyme